MSISLSGAGAFVGLMTGVGLTLTYAGLPRTRRPGLAARIHPYVDDRPRPSSLLAVAARRRSTAAILLGPVVGQMGAVIERVLGGATSVRRRLERAGMAPDIDRFRAEQVLWGVAGAVAGGALSVMGTGASPVMTLLLVGVVAGAAIVARDLLLTRSAGQREQRILAEFPTVAELLAMAVTAGEGTIGALERVCRLSRGALSVELGACLAEARVGASLPVALEGLADRTGLPSLARFVDGIVVALERGTPLADVLRAQAQDVREDGRRQLMEAGGAKEITMMIPVVFLILPITVLFAVFPGFTFLDVHL